MWPTSSGCWSSWASFPVRPRLRAEPLATGSQWYRLTLGTDSTSVPALVSKLRATDRPGDRRGTYRVSPNHVLRGNSHGGLGTASVPAPASELGPPPPGSGVLGGRTVTVAVLDSGDLFKHEWFNGRVKPLGRPGGLPALEIEPDHREPLRRYAGHAVFSVGVVLQHAPGAAVGVDRILDDWGEAPETEVAAALRRLTPDVEVVLLSCAGFTHDNIGMPAIEEALTELRERNPKVVFIAPAGNAGTDTPCFPAAYKGVIGVAALGTEKAKAWFSNYGSWVDVCAPGVDVRSTFLNFHGRNEPASIARPNAGPEQPPQRQLFDGWATWSGTCFAAARVAGAIAQVAARPGMDGALAAWEVFGGGRRRANDSGFDLGVPVFPPSWT